MKKRLMMVLFLALPLALCLSFAMAETMYVSTQDGDPLNVRTQPLISPDTLLGCIPNHTAVEVLSIDSDGWAKINYSTDDGRVINAYVSSRYLSYDQEGHYRSEQSAAPVPTAVPSAGQDHSMEDLNAELKTAKTVSETFSVLVRPSRSSGRVNLRWAPNSKTRAIRSYPANYKLTVLMETANWYQVRDPEAGDIGFISKKFVTVVLPELEE